MHLARISHLFYPDIRSDYLLELSCRQVKTGHKVDVFTWNKNKRPAEEKIATNLCIHRLLGINFSLDHMITDYPYLPSLPSRVESLEPDIVHAESHLFLPPVQAIRKSKQLGIPTIVTVHGVMARRGVILNSVQYAYLRTIGLSLFKKADKIICLTKSDAQEIAGLGCPSEKINVIPNAVDTERFRPENENRENIVAWVGRFVPEKGLIYLIEAAKIVLRKCKKTQFLLIGDGPFRTRYMRLAKSYSLLNSVHFVGPFDRDHVAAMLRKAALFVLPSLKEGMPLSLLEAMASCVPVIASDIPGVNEVVNNGYDGLLVAPKRPELLASTIVELLSDTDLSRKLGRHARISVEKRYGWPQVMDRLERVYYEVKN